MPLIHAGGDQLPAGAVRRAQLRADDEHEQHQADLRQAVERRQARRLEDVRVPFRKERTEHDRPEHDPGGHLPDHRRLSEAPEHEAQQPGGPEDQDQLQQQRRMWHSARPQAAESNSMLAACRAGRAVEQRKHAPGVEAGMLVAGRA